MTFQIINRPGHGVSTQEHTRAPVRRSGVHSALPRRSKLIVQARYSGEEDAAARRPTRPARRISRNDDDFDEPAERSSARRSWDDDFDVPSRMDKSNRGQDGGQEQQGRGGGGYRSSPSPWGSDRGTEEGSRSQDPDQSYRAPSTYRRPGGERDASRSSYRAPYQSEQAPRSFSGGDDERRPWKRANDDEAPRRWSSGEQGERRGGGGYNREAASEQAAQSRALNQAIKDTANWRELAAFVEEHGSVMSGDNVSSILMKLASRPPPRQQSQPSYNKADFARPREEEAAQEYDRLLSTLLGWVLVLVPKFGPRQVCMCLQSLSRLELWNLEVVTALVQSCIQLMGNLQPADYGSIVYAFAKFNYSPGQEFFDSFLIGSARKLSMMSPMDLGRCASSLSKLGCTPTAAWVEAFWKAVSDKIFDDEFTDIASGDMLMGVASFAQAGFQPPQQWVDRVFGAYIETQPERDARMAQLLAAHEQQVQQLMQQQMKQKDNVKPEAMPPKPTLQERPPPRVQIINKLLYTLSNLTCKPSPVWFAAIVDAWRRQLTYCTPTDLGNIALYLGRYLQLPVSQQMCSQLLRETARQARGMRGDDLAAVAYLLSTSRYKGTDKEIDDLVFLLKPQLPTCSLSGLELVYNALPALGSGYRLNETVTEAANRYHDLSSQQQAAAAAAGGEEGAQAAAVEETVAA